MMVGEGNMMVRGAEYWQYSRIYNVRTEVLMHVKDSVVVYTLNVSYNE